VGEATYSENAAYQTRGAWLGAVDIGAVAGAANPFADTTGAVGLGLTDAERARRHVLLPHVVAGVNGAAYAGNYGAYQYEGAGCEASAGITPTSGTVCLQGSATLAAQTGLDAQAYRWIWRTGPGAPWELIADGECAGPDGVPWFHASGAAGANCTISLLPGDAPGPQGVQVACVITAACATVTTAPATVYLIAGPPSAQVTPAAVSLCSSQVGTFHALTAPQAGAAFIYDWQLWDPQAGAWTALTEGMVVRNGHDVGEAHQVGQEYLGYRLIDAAYGTLRVVIGNGCASAASPGAVLRFTSADFDCDGDVGTDHDIEAFFACVAGNCPAPPCSSHADFDGDGDTGTDQDIEAFFRSLGGGGC
jgi:hypothetical protein